MAIAALSLDAAGDSPVRQRARAFAVAVRFATGHALLLALGAGVLVLLGWSLPLIVERAGEMLGGALLIVLGAVGLWSVFSRGEGRLSSPANHSHLPTILGAAFAISSLRALTMLAPFGDRVAGSPLPILVTLIAVFAAGILLSMSLFGVAFARVLSAAIAARLGQAAAAIMAAASIGLGVFWMASA